MDARQALRYKLSDLYPHELFFPDTRIDWARRNGFKLLAEGHSRFAAPLYNLAFMLMALAAVLGGAFNKLGYGPRIFIVAASAVVARVLGVAAEALAGSGALLNLLQYFIPVAAALAGAWVLFRGTAGGKARARAEPGPIAAEPRWST